MIADIVRLRRFTPALVFVATVVLGWLLFVRPVSADRARSGSHLADLRQREAALTAKLTEPWPPAMKVDPAGVFDSRVALEDPSAQVVAHLARLASDVRARDLLIETVGSTRQTGPGAPTVPDTEKPDLRFMLFERLLSYTTIKMSFQIDYAGLGRFLWSFRDLPTIVEIRTLNVQPRGPSSRGAPSQPDGIVQASLTLFAYSRGAKASVTREVSAEIDPMSVPSLPDVGLDRPPEWSRDPFVNARLQVAEPPPVVAREVDAEPDLVLASILHSPQRQLAIVNGRIVRVGDRIGSVTVRQIEPRSVIVELPGGALRTLELNGPLERVKP